MARAVRANAPKRVAEELRQGTPRTLGDARVERWMTATLNELPREATYWSTRARARKLKLSQSSVSRAWRAFGSQPHRSETFEPQSDSLFIDKVRDIVWSYPESVPKGLDVMLG